ncbi:MAG: 1-(5-phosphoribosyl)-5-amino-4-imidazole-carboxylate carboxylase [Firmicutes bacterium ML8_F2]|nr:MAG: 1-(5-phosphoribosyl)-5-amino-4-imidazole-carboxylate carboxylase [Firmicutes bacterium ML8_F2]
MQEKKLRELLIDLQEGRLGVDEAVENLRILPYEDLGFAKIDHQRQLRRGFPEVIFCPGKTVAQITAIIDRLAATGGTVLATRAGENIYDAVKNKYPQAEYNRTARTLIIRAVEEPQPVGLVVVISAGTADLPVAEEAAVTAELMGSRVERLFDVGVAGIHRLFDSWEVISKARSIVVAAGMEGALASVVGGLVACPVIAVPTSVGYGANFKGLAPLLTMLNSCATGVAVVNIDNGYGAGYTAALINRTGDDKNR